MSAGAFLSLRPADLHSQMIQRDVQYFRPSRTYLCRQLRTYVVPRNKANLSVSENCVFWRQPYFIFEQRNRNSTTGRKHFSNRNSATFKEMLLRNRNSAILQSQFFPKAATSSLQLETLTSAIFGIFLAVE
jgi:hypothetical protein